MKQLSRLSLLALLGVTAVCTPVHADRSRGPLSMDVKAAAPRAKSVVFEISKMHCEGCADALTQAAKGWTGVKGASVSFAQKRAMVTFDPKKTTAARIAKEFGRVGFPAKIVD